MKPKGGRGKTAPYATTHLRVPEPIKESLQAIIDGWRESGELPMNEAQALEVARQILKYKKSARESMRRLISEIYGCEVQDL